MTTLRSVCALAGALVLQASAPQAATTKTCAEWISLAEKTPGSANRIIGPVVETVMNHCAGNPALQAAARKGWRAGLSSPFKRDAALTSALATLIPSCADAVHARKVGELSPGCLAAVGFVAAPESRASDLRPGPVLFLGALLAQVYGGDAQSHAYLWLRAAFVLSALLELGD